MKKLFFICATLLFLMNCRAGDLPDRWIKTGEDSSNTIYMRDGLGGNKEMLLNLRSKQLYPDGSYTRSTIYVLKFHCGAGMVDALASTSYEDWWGRGSSKSLSNKNLLLVPKTPIRGSIIGDAYETVCGR